MEPDSTQTSVLSPVSNTPTSSKYEFEAEAWYKNGFTIYQNVHGKLALDNESIIMFDENDAQVFKLPYAEVRKVKLSPGNFKFIGASKSYYVTFYNMAKTGSKIVAGSVTAAAGGFGAAAGSVAAGAGSGAGVGSEIDAIDDILSTSDLSARLESSLRKHGVNVKGSASTSHEKKKIVFVAIGTILFIIAVALIFTLLFSGSK